MSALIQAKDLSIEFDGRKILDNVAIDIKGGEIVTVIGPNGAGKSSLVRLLVGALKLQSGSITRTDDLRVGYVPQKLAIDGTLPISVRRFLNLPRRTRKVAFDNAVDQTGISAILDQQIYNLSGGELKRVLLAHALLTRPQLLILDEPTAGLDQPSIMAFYELIARLRQEMGLAVILVSHDLHVVMRASDRVICLNGHICCQGAPAAVEETPEYLAMFGHRAPSVAIYQHQHDHVHQDGICEHGDKHV